MAPFENYRSSIWMLMNNALPEEEHSPDADQPVPRSRAASGTEDHDVGAEIIRDTNVEQSVELETGRNRPRQRGAGRAASVRRRYTGEMDIILLERVVNYKAHIARYGARMKSFQKVATDLNGSTDFVRAMRDDIANRTRTEIEDVRIWKATGKTCMDRLAVLLYRFNRGERAPIDLHEEEEEHFTRLCVEISEEISLEKEENDVRRSEERRQDDELNAAGAEVRRLSTRSISFSREDSIGVRESPVSREDNIVSSATGSFSPAPNTHAGKRGRDSKLDSLLSSMQRAEDHRIEQARKENERSEKELEIKRQKVESENANAAVSLQLQREIFEAKKEEAKERSKEAAKAAENTAKELEIRKVEVELAASQQKAQQEKDIAFLQAMTDMRRDIISLVGSRGLSSVGSAPGGPEMK